MSPDELGQNPARQADSRALEQVSADASVTAENQVVPPGRVLKHQ